MKGNGSIGAAKGNGSNGAAVTKRGVDETARALERRWTAACALAIAAGVGGLAWGVLQHCAQTAWATVVADCLFFAGAALGALAFRAVLGLTSARWADSILPLTLAPARFLPVGALTLGALVMAQRVWAPWASHPVERAFFYNTPFFTARELLVNVILFGAAWSFSRPERRANDEGAMRRAALFALVYSLALTVWAYDFVLGFDDEWVSTLIGPHLFVGSMIAGLALVTLLAVVSGRATVAQRQDLAKLMLAFSVVWIYFVWAQFLPIWYSNLPEEVGFVMRRLDGTWQPLVFVTMALSFLAPFLLLIRESAKKSRLILGVAAAAQLSGLWFERRLLVLPSLPAELVSPLDSSGLLIGVGFLGAFVLLVYLPTRASAPAIEVVMADADRATTAAAQSVTLPAQTSTPEPSLPPAL